MRSSAEIEIERRERRRHDRRGERHAKLRRALRDLQHEAGMQALGRREKRDVPDSEVQPEGDREQRADPGRAQRRMKEAGRRRRADADPLSEQQAQHQRAERIGVEHHLMRGEREPSLRWRGDEQTEENRAERSEHVPDVRADAFLDRCLKIRDRAVAAEPAGRDDARDRGQHPGGEDRERFEERAAGPEIRAREAARVTTEPVAGSEQQRMQDGSGDHVRAWAVRAGRMREARRAAAVDGALTMDGSRSTAVRGDAGGPPRSRTHRIIAENARRRVRAGCRPCGAIVIEAGMRRLSHAGLRVFAGLVRGANAATAGARHTVASPPHRRGGDRRAGGPCAAKAEGAAASVALARAHPDRRIEPRLSAGELVERAIEPRHRRRVLDARRGCFGVAAKGELDVARRLEKTLCGFGFPGMRDGRHGRFSSVAGHAPDMTSRPQALASRDAHRREPR
ncbi:hypothetical protein BMAA1601 [Burkholderia mallei ATCC 23344]|uniref:Uncharacterized protein n=1 Tax=Burkholderia mallei (strain ATCC 23344) TaxID=243160 RepID=A0A0H2XEU3_BURMA|nr:hypothetical protein BMAA1601 [Burkholderia mallei ATCC 23344]